MFGDYGFPPLTAGWMLMCVILHYPMFLSMCEVLDATGLSARMWRHMRSAAKVNKFKNDGQCYICYDNLTKTVKTSCDHVSCYTCIIKWLKLHYLQREFKLGNCPFCRTKVTKLTPVKDANGKKWWEKKSNSGSVLMMEKYNCTAENLQEVSMTWETLKDEFKKLLTPHCLKTTAVCFTVFHLSYMALVAAIFRAIFGIETVQEIPEIEKKFRSFLLTLLILMINFVNHCLLIVKFADYEE